MSTSMDECEQPNIVVHSY